jgi:hypothetical protein
VSCSVDRDALKMVVCYLVSLNCNANLFGIED